MATTEQTPQEPETPDDAVASLSPDLGLMSKVNDLALNRRAARLVKEEARREAMRAAESARVDKVSSTIKRCVKEEMTRYIQIGDRIRASRARIAKRRSRVGSLFERTDTELEALMEKAIDDETRVGLRQRNDEDKDRFDERIKMLEDALDGITILRNRHKALEKVRYLDGYPVNIEVWSPKFKPPDCPVYSMCGKCLQCRAKRIRCSHSRVSFHRWDYEYACTRCRMHGDACMVKEPEDVDVEDSWFFADPEMRVPESESGVDKDVLTKELMDKRRRAGVIKPFPAWHENEHPDNKTDWTFNPKTWKDVLKDRPTKWLTRKPDLDETDEEEYYRASPSILRQVLAENSFH
ncbi:hypothetical protein QQX98_006120 [Neonectria punicea]|uniref:Zn(2)-C6 fungal-type domain-containing protein n=1 Tax=Neonectria punicea TaxID=979145 RepID=A0ABR1H1V3_9HYPO